MPNFIHFNFGVFSFAFWRFFFRFLAFFLSLFPFFSFSESFFRLFCWRSLSALPIRSLFLLALPIGFADTVAFCASIAGWQYAARRPIAQAQYGLLLALPIACRQYGRFLRVYCRLAIRRASALLRKRNTGFWVRYAGAYAHPSAVAHAATALRQRRSEISARVYDSHHPRYATPSIWRIERYAQWR